MRGGSPKSPISIGSVTGRISLSNLNVSEDAAVDFIVGILSVTGVSGAPLFSLDDDAGGKFYLDDDTIKVAAPLDFETLNSHTIIVSVSDVSPSLAPTSFVIAVINEPEGGFLLLESGDILLAENDDLFVLENTP
jgi:hypothetical protein